LVESYRNESGQPRQRTVASLGRLDEVGGGVGSLLAGLLRHKGLPASAALPSQLEFDPALSFGDVSALDQIWCELGFDALAGPQRQTSCRFPVQADDPRRSDKKCQEINIHQNS
jgi:hypothetical protein